MENLSINKIIKILIVLVLVLLAGVLGFYYYWQQQAPDPFEGLILLENGEPDPNQMGTVTGNLSPESYERIMEYLNQRKQGNSAPTNQESSTTIELEAETQP